MCLLLEDLLYDLIFVLFVHRCWSIIRIFNAGLSEGLSLIFIFRLNFIFSMKFLPPQHTTQHRITHYTHPPIQIEANRTKPSQAKPNERGKSSGEKQRFKSIGILFDI